MDLETQLPATERDARTALNNNFVKLQQEDEKDDAHINAVDAKHNENEQMLDQKYSRITNKLKEQCTNLEEGEEKLDSDKASKVMLYKWWKELDDKFSACVDELDDKKASKKHVRANFQELSQLVQQFEEKITKQVDNDHNDLVELINENYQKMNDKAERVALGTDRDTVRQVVMLILQEQGIVPATTEIPKIKDPDKAASAAGEVAAVSSGEDSRAQAASAALAELNLPKE